MPYFEDCGEKTLNVRYWWQRFNLHTYVMSDSLQKIQKKLGEFAE